MSKLFQSVFRTSGPASIPLNVFKAPMRTACKYDRSLWKRKMGSKRGDKHYYKGTQSRNEGRFTKRGQFKTMPERTLSLNVPDLTGFELKPYVAETTPKVPMSMIPPIFPAKSRAEFPDVDITLEEWQHEMQ